ncbi:MAG: Re/Si-specific NAD(P)(+) transhydrogenase subunit alpha [Saprospiraceae bacterium]|nr:Re/Si-specific NAD(P)(+) transhydrogenase subunit alpha [Saprospiraceae bacterium]
MKLGIPKEQGDQRVAVVPATLPKLKDLGLEVLIETAAGAGSMYNDSEYANLAQVVSREELLRQSDIILSVNPLPDNELRQLKENTLLISLFQPYVDDTITDKLRKYKLRGCSFDMIPRTTLAQSMDILSSMAAVAGYRAVLEAARYLPRYFPMMITAAGSIPPSKVLILGAGVAGLQAIATAKRLGAQVEAFDTRAAAKEEVESLGAKFVEVAGAKDDKGAGGYAVEQSEEFLKRQREEVQARAAKADIIITTAQVRGRKAPVLVPKETVEKMKRGSVIVDLAASTGGNCELTQNDQVIQHNGVTIIGNSNLAEQMPQDSSVLFSNNALNFLRVIVNKGELNLDLNNEIVRGAFFTAESVEAQS